MAAEETATAQAKEKKACVTTDVIYLAETFLLGFFENIFRIFSFLSDFFRILLGFSFPNI